MNFSKSEFHSNENQGEKESEQKDSERKNELDDYVEGESRAVKSNSKDCKDN